MNICVLPIFMFLIHYCCRYYTNDKEWKNETAASAESMRQSLAENVKGQSLQHTNITQTRRVKRELICLAQQFIFVGLITFPADFNFCVCRYIKYSLKSLKCLAKAPITSLVTVYIGSSDNDTTVIATRITSELDKWPIYLGNLLTYFLNWSLRLQVKNNFHVNEILNRKLKFSRIVYILEPIFL